MKGGVALILCEIFGLSLQQGQFFVAFGRTLNILCSWMKMLVI